ncbi:MAG: flagellar basal-body rod protein FlgB [Spirochaetes bacterium GWD1_61_31]|nr:MAG: flagellar basal-body rod protein FlgB [Spirochaetes bacterium GWB1_60_80]OHD34709.1 MAG: flagellar basal-body rod protein FlgB [Spirochaetes bacterium GWC1_61_12]OHD38758.1 MAG: flagellar basal-body rod protein FlgB [Spirochaetes bacterium GWD1_61_31]OHD44502.1 MAG: flagellar basal-body rod protein FlgB [Spirochaetes bacterium GWE1_60_18]OHD59347.1 MAG: flagellar basal-body rod protein FlgB [Spirochaetes bacterium GWF1_60_12]HAP43155.1 flagellar basal body rod protein FlgB [Spirochaeta
MLENTGFGRSVEMLQRSMDVSLLRRDVIANNIANADVPNYKRSVINFEATLSRAVEAEDLQPRLLLATTDERHISNDRQTDWRSVQPRRVLDYLSTEKNNGNNVNPEEEFMDAMTNQLTYSLMTQAVNFEFNQVNLVLR